MITRLDEIVDNCKFETNHRRKLQKPFTLVVRKLTKQSRKGIGRKPEKRVMIKSFSFIETKCE
jgi:hypothetical protein